MKHNGFTLVEVLVSTAIFSIVMVVALGALLSLSESDRRAETFSTAMNNVSFALESMTRTIRTGATYHCGAAAPLTSPSDCAATPGDTFAFKDANGVTTVYRWSTAGQCGTVSNRCIMRSTDGGTTYMTLTAPDVSIDNLGFYVVGSTSGSPDNTQPRVTVVLVGHVASSAKTQTNFNIQTTVTQRLYDQ